MPKITSENLGIALGGYIEQELVPKAGGLQKVMLYMALPVIRVQTPQMVRQYAPALKLLDGLTDDGMIDLDKMYPALKDAVHKAGKVPVMGIIFDETDVDKLYAIAQPLAQ